MAERPMPTTQAEFDALTEGLLGSYRDLKVEVVERARREGDPDRDALLLLHWQAPEGGTVLALPQGTEHLDVVVAEARQRMGEPLWVALLSDAYYREAQDEEKMKRVERGQLQREHAGGDTRVRECLMVFAVSRLFRASLRLPFHYDADDRIVFADRGLDDRQMGTAGGWIPDCLEKAFQ
jgi:hypothetical protein